MIKGFGLKIRSHNFPINRFLIFVKSNLLSFDLFQTKNYVISII